MNDYTCDQLDCTNSINQHRYELGYTTCKSCGEAAARKRKFCIVPMHKSNYTVITDRRDLMGINNKGGFYR